MENELQSSRGRRVEGEGDEAEAKNDAALAY